MTRTTQRAATPSKFLFLLLFVSISCISEPATSGPCNTHGQQRPSIGLALSGGGARGAAHVGVLKELEELRVPIDCIAGTSMGSIIAGLYASGMTPADIQQALADIDWEGVFQDKPERADRTFRRKTDDLLFLVEEKPGVKDGEINIASAMIQGQKFNLALKRLTLPVTDIKDFDQLRIPFRAVATDITTGDQVVLGSGGLAKAMRASMSVPAAFAAIEWEGKLLVDGGVSNNLPISVVRDMGADIVIAVDISTPLLSRKELDSGLDVLAQLSGLLTNRNTEAQLATLTDRDVHIEPDLGDITSADFNRVLETVPIGQNAAQAKRGDLTRIAVSETEYKQYLAEHRVIRERVHTIDFVRIDTNSRVSDETIAAHLDIAPGEPLDLDKLEAGIGHVYGMDIFEGVYYNVVQENGKTGIEVRAREKSWGTDSIQVGLELSADLDGDSFFNIGGAYTKIPLNSLNGEWRTLVRLGEEPALVTEIYQPLDPAERWFLSGGVVIESISSRLFEGDDAIADYNVDRYGIRLGGGYNFDTWGRLQLAWERFAGDADVTVGDPSRGFDFDQGELHLSGLVDTLDNVHFPRHGEFGLVSWVASRDEFGADEDFNQYRFRLGSARSWGDHTVLGGARYDTTPDDDAPVQNLFTLGGFQRLSGFQQRELSGQHAALLKGGYMYRMTDKIVPTYVGASLELGNTWQDSSDIEFNNTLLAGSLFIGADTALGPVYVAFGHAEGGNNAFYLFLGQPWFGR